MMIFKKSLDGHLLCIQLPDESCIVISLPFDRCKPGEGRMGSTRMLYKQHGKELSSSDLSPNQPACDSDHQRNRVNPQGLCSMVATVAADDSKRIGIEERR